MVQLLSKEQKVQECDARDDDQGTIAGNKKINLILNLKLNMAIIDLIMPKLGESIMEATILKWLKQPGDAVKMDETVLEIATD